MPKGKGDFATRLAGDMLERFTLSPHRSVGPERSALLRSTSGQRAWSDAYASLHAIRDFKDTRAFKGYSDADVTILGSGSMQPLLQRKLNFTSDAKGAALFDCGEGTLMQIHRLLGKEEASRFVAEDLRVAFISHFHADHFSGLISVIAARKRTRSSTKRNVKPLQVIGCSVLSGLLSSYVRGVGSKLNSMFKFHLHGSCPTKRLEFRGRCPRTERSC